ncbi:MAG: hypothetical protein NVS4B9_12120 [Ktedonobacteraceae bacterium]
MRPKYPRAYTTTEKLGRDVTRIPTMPPATAIWQYETPRYEVESSLSSLSLAISEATRLHHPPIDEIKTIPQVSKALSTEERRGSGSGRGGRREYTPVTTQSIDIAELKTAPEFVQRQDVLQASILHPFDRFRWWLLAPGRIEFILWIFGTVVLLCVTVILVFMMVASMGLLPGDAQQNRASSICSTGDSVQKKNAQGETCTLSTVSSSSGLRITMVNGDLMETGSVLQLRGQGFHPLGRISITRDANLPCVPSMIQANERGDFAVTMKLDGKAYWGAGRHQVKINDLDSKNAIVFNIMLEPQK